ncbi:MAG TPA: 2TM domain-containing protein [Flavobacterium sp.]|jgi:hypothetical protein|nr:2TM domain-containing protein [Flavobacterium sp.]HPJ09647.1 2TM domain-containing protein [Flavobacterium sp.]
MRKYSKYNFEEEELLRNNPDPNYVSAYRRMKRIKAFYVHLFIYVLVNALLIAVNWIENSSEGQEFWRWQTFSTALFWGVGLVGHGLSVFNSNFLFGSNWEQRKIAQLMKNQREEKWE